MSTLEYACSKHLFLSILVQMKDENSEEVDASNSSFSSSFFDSQLRTDESWESDKISKV